MGLGGARGEIRNGGGPQDFAPLQIMEKQLPHRLLLPPHGALGKPRDFIGGGDQQPVAELGPRRLREKAIDISLLDRVVRVVCLRLDGP